MPRFSVQRCLTAARVKQHKAQEDGEEACVEGGKEEQVALETSGVEALVVAVGDEGGEGGDERSCAADVHADEQVAVVVRELGEEDGHVHYHV